MVCMSLKIRTGFTFFDSRNSIKELDPDSSISGPWLNHLISFHHFLRV